MNADPKMEDMGTGGPLSSICG